MTGGRGFLCAFRCFLLWKRFFHFLIFGPCFVVFLNFLFFFALTFHKCQIVMKAILSIFWFLDPFFWIFFSFLLWPSTSVKLLWKRFFQFSDFWTIFCCFVFVFSFLLWPSTSVKLLWKRFFHFLIFGPFFKVLFSSFHFCFDLPQMSVC